MFIVKGKLKLSSSADIEAGSAEVLEDTAVVAVEASEEASEEALEEASEDAGISASEMLMRVLKLKRCKIHNNSKTNLIKL